MRESWPKSSVVAIALPGPNFLNENFLLLASECQKLGKMKKELTLDFLAMN